MVDLSGRRSTRSKSTVTAVVASRVCWAPENFETPLECKVQYLVQVRKRSGATDTHWAYLARHELNQLHVDYDVPLREMKPPPPRPKKGELATTGQRHIAHSPIESPSPSTSPVLKPRPGPNHLYNTVTRGCAVASC